MKSKINILMALLISQVSVANLSGKLDTTFSNDGTTDGWLLYDTNDINHTFRSHDVVVDSLGRVIVVGNFSVQHNPNLGIEYQTRLKRYLKNGQLDTSFGNNGVVDFILTSSSYNEEKINKLALTPHDAIFIGSSRLKCISEFESECHFDVKINFVNSHGVKAGKIDIPFDYASTPIRKRDVFKDLVYVATSNPEIGKVAITAEVSRELSSDTDFGIAVIKADLVTGELFMDTSFHFDGKTECHFNQTDGSRNQDSPTSISWNKQGNTYIVAGTIYEGVYPDNYGQNMGFCEFSQGGTLLRQWSTKNNNTFDVKSFESANDIQIGEDSEGAVSLYVTGTMDGATDGDLTLMRYQQTIFGEWFIDTSFGANLTGISTAGFSLPFIGDTSDVPSELHIEKDGSILVFGRGTWNDPTLKSALIFAKFKQNGELDTSWGIGQAGKVILPLATSAAYYDFASGLTEDPKTQEIYVVGYTKDSVNNRYLGFVVNMHNDVIFKNNFE